MKIKIQSARKSIIFLFGVMVRLYLLESTLQNFIIFYFSGVLYNIFCCPHYTTQKNYNYIKKRPAALLTAQFNTLLVGSLQNRSCSNYSIGGALKEVHLFI